MGLEIYYKANIQNALLAAEQASAAAIQATGLGNDFARGYQEGYRAALLTIALAFGLVLGGQDQGLVPQPATPNYRREVEYVTAPDGP